ncbi:TraR/DksA C4-type zinc finger protein [Patescibacteria group bacterium]|nr:TraR/DksA C4-type zinc finger protein [Patescibacteria group bacterium]MBU4023200.1 TraR/DksA C4-type zinc finger protein [Patescibacteria group bacterium]
MEESFIIKQKQRLQEEKKLLEKGLETFAKRDPEIKGNWNSMFPEFGASETGGSRMEVAQDEVEEYLKRLPLEQAMEIKLQNIEKAIKKISQKKYGKCEKCNKNIARERLEVHPSAKFCTKCQHAIL